MLSHYHGAHYLGLRGSNLDYGKAIAEDIEIDEFPSMEQAKTLARESQISNDAEKTRKRTLEKLNELCKEFKSLIEENKKLKSVDILPESAFEVDVDLLEIMKKKNNSWNIRCLVDDLFVPSSKQPSVIYSRLTDFWRCCDDLENNLNL